MAREQSTIEGPDLQHPGAFRWSPRLGRFGALLTLLIPLAMLVVGWMSRDVANLPVPQTRPGRLPDAHWEAKSTLATPRDDFGLAVAGDRLWAIGGTGGDRGARLDSTETYDPATDSWNGGPILPTGRSLFGTAALGDTIYLLGGSSGADSTVSDVDALDTRTGQWRALAPLPTALAGSAAIELGGTIYALGGTNGTGPVSTVYAYTATTNAWREVAPLPTARHGLAAVVFNGKIYALGGMVDGAPSKVVEIFDPASGGWTGGIPMLGPMSNFGAAAFNGRIHAMSQGVHQVFDPRANKWVTESPMPTVRQGQGVATLGDTIYAIGGRGGEPPVTVAQVEAYLPGEAVEPDNFQVTGVNRGGAIAVVAGLILTFTLMGVMLRVGRRRPTPDDEQPEEAVR